MGSDGSKNVYFKSHKPPLHCRLSQQISNCKKAEDLSADSLILPCKIIFPENGLPKQIMSDVVAILFQINSSNSAKI